MKAFEDGGKPLIKKIEVALAVKNVILAKTESYARIKSFIVVFASIRQQNCRRETAIYPSDDRRC